MEQKINKIKELKLQIEEFRNLTSFESQQMYIYEHFSEMRLKVDMAFTSKVMDESESIKYQIDKNWFEIIDEIKIFENECLEKNKLTKSCIDVEQLDKLNAKLTEELAKVKEKMFEANESYFDSIVIQTAINDFEKLIGEIRYNLEKHLFLNKTISFLEREVNQKEKHFFSKMLRNITTGKLIIIPEVYFTQNQITKSFKYLKKILYIIFKVIY